MQQGRRAAKLKDHILPLVLLKRVSGVFYDEETRLWKESCNPDSAADLVDRSYALVRSRRRVAPTKRSPALRRMRPIIAKYSSSDPV